MISRGYIDMVISVLGRERVFLVVFVIDVGSCNVVLVKCFYNKEMENLDRNEMK